MPPVTGGHKKRKMSLKLLENDGALLSNKWLNWIKVLVCQTEHIIQNHSKFLSFDIVSQSVP